MSFAILKNVTQWWCRNGKDGFITESERDWFLSLLE